MTPTAPDTCEQLALSLRFQASPSAPKLYRVAKTYSLLLSLNGKNCERTIGAKMAARPAVTLTAEEHATLQRVRIAVQAVASSSGSGELGSAQALAQALAARCGLVATVRQGISTDFHHMRHAFLLVQLYPGQGTPIRMVSPLSRVATFAHRL